MNLQSFKLAATRNSKLVYCKKESWKNKGFSGIRTYDNCDTAAALKPNELEKPTLGDQVIFSGSINATLGFITIIETDFVPHCKHWRYK